MLPDEDDNSTFGADPPEPREPSLREIAEQAYDEVSEDSQDDGDDGSPDRGDGRDRRGRFASNREKTQTGEAEDDEPPSPDKTAETQVQPDPASKGNQLQEHWSAEDRATFAKAPQDVKDMFMRRYSEMEADYTRKSQANAQAIQTINALSPIFQDPDIARSLQEMRWHPVQAIQDWARVHKLASDANPQTRASILYELAERMGFDPAKVFASNRQSDQPVPETVRNDPAYKFVADLNSRTNSDLQALRAELHQFQRAETERVEGQALQSTLGWVNNFADEKGPDGRPIRPYFNHVIQTIIDLYKANPQRDLQQTYDEACWGNPEIRQELMRAEWSRQQHASSNQRAQQAARSNVRGLTTPVSKPAQERKGNGSLRETLESSADEVGL